MNAPSKATPAVLLILDGFGNAPESSDNAITLAHKPNLDALWQQYPHTLINASESYVGLPAGQMGNSEVGHLNIGAGRVVYQDFERINHAIETGEFFANPTLVEAVQKARDGGHALHIFGLLSDGGVHSHELHIHAMVDMAARAGVKHIYIHAFLDGRDTPPRSAQHYLQRLEEKCAELKAGRIASIVGRYYAMDRDKRWARVESAYNLIAGGAGEFIAASAEQGLQAAYARDENDEFVKATAIVPTGETPVRVQDGDVIVYMNFRSDRTRELTSAFLDADFDGFERRYTPKLGGYYTLTMYDKNMANARVVFPPESIINGFGEYVAKLGMKQLRIAETEKYPHVTFFLNGGEERVYEGEDRILVQSPSVATYDLKPEMSAFEVTDKLEQAILSGKYDVIICNYANCDMVGHTGVIPAAIKAVEAIDNALQRIVDALKSVGGQLLLTADHGNIEQMVDKTTGQPHTAHSTNPVPLVYVCGNRPLASGGSLSDLAPTMLDILGVDKPIEMTGKSLIL